MYSSTVRDRCASFLQPWRDRSRRQRELLEIDSLTRDATARAYDELLLTTTRGLRPPSSGSLRSLAAKFEERRGAGFTAIDGAIPPPARDGGRSDGREDAVAGLRETDL